MVESDIDLPVLIQFSSILGYIGSRFSSLGSPFSSTYFDFVKVSDVLSTFLRTLE